MEVSNNMKEIVAQLSNREKKLLYFLVCFLIVVGGWFLVISPALDKNSKLNVEYQSVLIQNTTKQTELSQYLNAQDELKIKEDNLNQLIEKYNPILSNEKIDKLLTSTFLSQGLTPISMTISDATPVKANSSSENKKNSESDKKTEDSNKTKQLSSDYVYQVKVNVSVSGSLTQIANTIEAIQKMKGIEVYKFNYNKSNDLSKSDAATLEISVYMAK